MDVVEAQRPDFTAAQAIGCEQKEHGVVAIAVGLTSVYHGE